ncbi:MAG: hypothetical protein AMJ66_01280 [Betaproteobacteria bacterium SG8_40]|nr:MAG: hypothetical protein AMJ66_01280 [Betaproteobacteria bacterium SG8_40]
MTQDTPSLFISHGAPTIALDAGDATHRFLRGLGRALGRPEAVLVVSAHWEADAPHVSSAIRPETIHDFYGFPDPLYRLVYPAPGAPALASRVAQLLPDAGIQVTVDAERGLDHGAWIPLMLMYPEADIPVTQLSVQVASGPEHHYRVGKALRVLRREGVLIIGSGGFTHNLGAVDFHSESTVLPAWGEEFRAWVDRAIEEGRIDDLLNYRSMAPHAARNHPREEHFLPLFAALGAGGGATRVHTDVAYGTLAMDAYRFD